MTESHLRHPDFPHHQPPQLALAQVNKKLNAQIRGTPRHAAITDLKEKLGGDMNKRWNLVRFAREYSWLHLLYFRFPLSTKVLCIHMH